VQVELRANHAWVAIDGKTLRGTLASGQKQSVVFAVSHARRKVQMEAGSGTTCHLYFARDKMKLLRTSGKS